MRMSRLILKTLFVFISLFMWIDKSYTQETKTTNISINEIIEGTLLEPDSANTLAIIIPDAGPVDRNGNQNYYRSGYLKQLAYELAKLQIASFRYDKRTIKQLKSGILDEDIHFNDFVEDAKSVISYFLNENKFNSIYVIGHGQGSLVGMLALNSDLSGFISLNGSAKPIDEVLIEQVKQSAPEYLAETKEVIDQLRSGNTTANYPKALENAFNLETQPFLMSWMKHSPTSVLKTVTIPVLLIQGTKDLQISENAGQLLKESCTNCKLLMVKNMNHVLFEILGSDLDNYKSYADPNFKISPELLSAAAAFMLQD